MQKSLLFLGLSLCLSLSLIAQQSVQVEYGVSRGTQKNAESISLSWHRNDALKSGHVIRMNYDKSVSDNKQKIKSRSLQLDVAKRWHSSLDKKMKLYLEGGLSGIIINSQNQWNRENPYQYDLIAVTDCVFCLTSSENFGPTEFIFTEENSLLLYDNNKKPYALNIMPGATFGGGMDINLSQSFYMGLHYRMNVYYWVGENELLFYMRYGLNAGFMF